MERMARVEAGKARWATAGRAAGLILLALALLAIGLAALGLAGPVVRAEVPEPSLDVVNLQPDRTLGQTFIPRGDGLEGVEVFLQPREPGDGTITLRLRSDPGSDEDLAAAALPAASVSYPGFYRFSFPTRPESADQSYYFELEYAGEGRVKAGRAPVNAYLDGAAYRDGDPMDAQLSFRLAYAPWPYALGSARQLLTLVLAAALALVLLALPGWALLALLLHGWDGRGWGEKLGLAGGLTLALYPLLLLWTAVAGVRLGSLYAWLPAGLSLAILAWRNRGWRPAAAAPALRHWAAPGVHDLALLVVLALIVGARLLAVRHADAPLWGDSVQHTVMAQLMLDGGGLFTSWEPYAPYHSLTVQFGFPAASAIYAWISGAAAPAAVLVVGQLVNALAVLAIYPLAVRVTGGNRWAGVGALVVAGLLLALPGLYVNWGRYAQLGGQAILPVALYMLWETLDRPRPDWRAILLAGVALGGMLLTYYRMPFYAAPFVLALLLTWALPRWRTDWRAWLRGGLSLALAGAVAGALLAPWALQVSSSQLATVISQGDKIRTPLDDVLADYRIWGELGSYFAWPLLVAAAAAVVWSLARRQWLVAGVGLWTAGMASVVAGRLVGVPGTSSMQNFAIIIALYIPIGILAGWLAADLTGLAVRRRGRVAAGAAGLALAVAAAWGAAQQAAVLRPEYVLVTRPDLEAAAWVRDNTAPDARFLVQGFSINQGTSAVGADAGWWLPLLAGRANTMPPQYALLNEVPSPPDYSRRVVEFVRGLEQAGPETAEGLRRLCAEGVSHVFVGQREGRVGSGVRQLFSTEGLSASPSFEPLYRRDRVAIFALRPEACQAAP